MGKLRIGVDMDDVLSETNLSVLNFIKDNKIPIDIKYETRKHYYLGKNSGVDLTLENSKKLYHSVFENDVNLEIPIVNGSKDKLLILKEKGHHLHLITARDLASKEYSIKWLEKHFTGIFDSVTFIEEENFPSHSKGEVCKALSIDYMIEDCHDFITDVASVGVKGFLINKPWNEDILHLHENIKRVSSWAEIKID